MRLFIAVEIPDEIKKNIVERINELKPVEAVVKWVAKENLHITLKFLGWVEEKDLDKLIKMTSKAVESFNRFKVNFAGLGTFPEGKAPRVVWVGMGEGAEEMGKLAEALENKLSRAGFRSEPRGFKPHLTIGRIKAKKGVDNLKTNLAAIKEPKFGETEVDSLFIMKSTLTSKGPIYEKIKEVKL